MLFQDVDEETLAGCAQDNKVVVALKTAILSTLLSIAVQVRAA